MDTIVDISAQAVELPLKETFETAQRRADTSPTVFVRIKLSNGVVGLGEATPVKNVTGEDQSTVMDTIGQLRSAVIGRTPGEYRLLSYEMAEAVPDAKSARNGVEIALLDSLGKSYGIPVYSILGGKRTRIESDITIPVVPPAHAAELAQKAAEFGFKIFKVKVGGKDYDADIERVLAITSVKQDCSIVADANQGYEPEQAISFIKTITERGVKVNLLEQPVYKEDFDGLKWVTDHSPVPVFADESARTQADVIELIRRNAVHGVNVKLMKAGVVGAIEIVSICRAAGVKLMLGCMLESKIGASASLHVAGGTGAFSHFDLDSDHLLAGQPVKGGYIREGAYLLPDDKPGFGCSL